MKEQELNQETFSNETVDQFFERSIREGLAPWGSPEEEIIRCEKRYETIQGILGLYKQGILNSFLDTIDPNKENFIARKNLEFAEPSERETILTNIVDLVLKKQDEEQKEKNVIIAKFDALNNALLKEAVQHTKVWKRASYEIAGDDLDNFYNRFTNEGFSPLIRNHEYPDPDYDGNGYPPFKQMEFRKEKPDFAFIEVEFIDQETNLQLRFVYEDSHNTDIVNIFLDPRKPTIISDVYSYALTETGYEGHDFLGIPTFNEDWEKLYQLISEFSKNPIKEKPMEEQMADTVLVDMETGERHYYNPETKDWELPKRKVKREKNDKMLKVVAAYKIEQITDEEREMLKKRFKVN